MAVKDRKASQKIHFVVRKLTASAPNQINWAAWRTHTYWPQFQHKETLRVPTAFYWSPSFHSAPYTTNVAHDIINERPPSHQASYSQFSQQKSSVLAQSTVFPPQSLLSIIDGSAAVEYFTGAVLPVISIKILVGQINRTGAKWQTIMLTPFHVCSVANALHPALGSFLITRMCTLTQTDAVNNHSQRLNTRLNTRGRFLHWHCADRCTL